MSEKISNSILLKISELCRKDISLSINECGDLVGISGATLSRWRRNLRTGKWKSGYLKTSDGKSLTQHSIDLFDKSFVFGENCSKILSRLVTPKCLNNRECLNKQRKILKRLVKKYPNINFWLYAAFGEPRDDMLLFTGKGEATIKQKYVDFSVEYSYNQYKKTGVKPLPPLPKRIKTTWDYYDQ